MTQIAILQTAFLGDTLLSIPLAKQLASQGHRLALVCRKGYGGLLLATRLFENVIEIEKGSSVSYREAQEHLNIWWAGSGSRILLSPHESPRSKMFALGLRMKGEATCTIGYRDRGLAQGPSFAAYTDRIARPMALPEAIRQLALLQSDQVSGAEAAALWKSRIDEFTRAQELSGGRLKSGELMQVPAWASMKIESLGPEKIGQSEFRDNIAILSPGSVWRTKQWTEEGFIEIGRRFNERGKQVVLTGTKDEAELCERIALGIGEGARSIAGEISLLETAHEMARAEIAVVNDSGGMHVAAIADTPVVAVFGPTILDFGYRPWSNKARIVEPGALECRPCGLHGSQTCPIGTHVCMRGTSADKVWNAVKSLLG
jgi:heptosyltransferase II